MNPKHTPQILQPELPYPEFCECGCGQLAPISSRNDTKFGWVKGQPKRFIRGHAARRPAKKRFWSKVDKRGLDDCWEWQAGKDADGYGQFWFNGKNIPAHRYSYELHYGPISDGMLVCHECDNHPCCNPCHLFDGTPADNSEDMKIKGRAAAGIKHGMSKLNPDAVIEIRRRCALGESQESIARHFGVDQTTISSAVLKKTWAHV